MWGRFPLVAAVLATALSAKPRCRDSAGTGVWHDCTVRIGGLAIQGAAAFETNFEFVSNGSVDFIYSNPAAYTCMAVEFNLQTVASLINYRKGNALGKFAGAWVA
eukprot:s580_g17.t1